MFYVGHLLKAQLIFAHHDLKNLNSPSFVLSKLKQAFEGRCSEEFGYFIQILPMKGADSKGGIRIGQIQVASEGCITGMQFDCLCFKPHKNDVIDIFINSVDSEMVQGRIGAAQVMIPRHRMGPFEYDERMNKYSCFICDGSKVEIDIGQKIRCRCLEWIVENDMHMKIICEIDSLALDSRVIGRF